jgi:hypothetical protein
MKCADFFRPVRRLNDRMRFFGIAVIVLDCTPQVRHDNLGDSAVATTGYLTMIDENGEPVRINDANELTIYSYKTAAEEHGLQKEELRFVARVHLSGVGVPELDAPMLLGL